MATGPELLQCARAHLGEPYRFGARVPKDDPHWRGPWDCAEFVSWLVYQVSGALYGCADNSVRPRIADAWTGYWARDVESLGASSRVLREIELVHRKLIAMHLEREPRSVRVLNELRRS